MKAGPENTSRSTCADAAFLDVLPKLYFCIKGKDWDQIGTKYHKNTNLFIHD